MSSGWLWFGFAHELGSLALRRTEILGAKTPRLPAFPQTFLSTISILPDTMPFAQLIVGPPGSGKSTYCNGMHQFLSAIGRKCSIVNLDPANEQTSYPSALDIRSLVTLEEIMADEELGPNGGVLYALEELEHNEEWLKGGLEPFGEDYVLFDCPGQVELFTHHDSLKRIFLRIQKLGYRVRLSPMLRLESSDHGLNGLANDISLA